MSKILAVMIAGLFAAGAYAQGAKEVAQEKGPETDSKAQQRAEMKKDAKPAGKVVLPMGDTDKAQEANPTVTDKATITGEKRAETRDDRRRNKDGSIKQKSTQGGTPASAPN